MMKVDGGMYEAGFQGLCSRVCRQILTDTLPCSGSGWRRVRLSIQPRVRSSGAEVGRARAFTDCNSHFDNYAFEHSHRNRHTDAHAHGDTDQHTHIDLHSHAHADANDYIHGYCDPDADADGNWYANCNSHVDADGNLNVNC